MKVLTITGDHPRHLRLVQQISNSFETVSVVMSREGLLASENSASSLMRRHFEIRGQVENEWFGSPQKKDLASVVVDAGSMMSGEIGVGQREIGSFDVCVVFGTTLLPESLRQSLPEMTLNLHLGISPRYRGAATLFWPFYMLEPNWAGFTIHKLTREPDRGDILVRHGAKLLRGQRLHDVSASVTNEGINSFVNALRMLGSGADLVLTPQKSSGKNWLSSDFSEKHLSLIYEHYNDDIVDRFLDGELGPSKSPLEIRLPSEIQ